MKIMNQMGLRVNASLVEEISLLDSEHEGVELLQREWREEEEES